MSFAVGPELGIVQAADVQAQWLQTLAELDAAPPREPAPLALDLSGVQDIDSAGVQLLLALRRALAERGLALSLGAPSPVAMAALRSLGLNDQLDPV